LRKQDNSKIELRHFLVCLAQIVRLVSIGILQFMKQIQNMVKNLLYQKLFAEITIMLIYLLMKMTIFSILRD